MTTTEVNNALIQAGLDKNVWLHETRPWEKIATVCLQSTYHVYLNPEYDYRFNSVDGVLEVSLMDTARTIKKIVDYSNIVCFNGTYYYDRGVPNIKSFR